MKLLLVEDEPKLSEYLRKGLGEEGFVVDAALNGIDGLHMASVNDYDLIILDGNLPASTAWPCSPPCARPGRSGRPRC